MTKKWTDQQIAEMEVTTPEAAVRTLLNTAFLMKSEGDNLTKLRGAYIEQAVAVLRENGMPLHPVNRLLSTLPPARPLTDPAKEYVGGIVPGPGNIR